MNVAAGVAAAGGFWYAALLWALAGGGCDLLDGTLARLSPKSSKFGALWDSALDRYSDALLIGGVGFYFARQGELLVLLAALSAIAGAFQISYVRARAEGLGFSCRVGFWERGERWVLLLVGLAASHPATAVLILAFAAHGTAAHRLIHIYRRSSHLEVSATPQDNKPKWSLPLNWLWAAAAIICVLMVRWPVLAQN